MSDHIHTPHDGRGKRRVFVNGREVKLVLMADMRRCVVIAVRRPPRLDRWKKRILTYTIRGKVEVVPMVDE